MLTCESQFRFLGPFKNYFSVKTIDSNHGLRMPNEAFFHWNSKLLGLGRQIGLIQFGAFGVILANLSAPFLVLWVPCPRFSLINLKSTPQISIWDWDLNFCCKDLLFNCLLTLSDAGFWEVSFSEKWSLSYQIFFQMKI